MKERILKLRNAGKSYKEIKKELGCSLSTIAYHCGDGQKEKTKTRRIKRMKNPLIKKVDNFKYKKRKNVIESIRKFQKRDNSVKRNINKAISVTFTWEDVVNKFGENTTCYLSGEKINLFSPNCALDHIIPAAKNGPNTLDNLGITHDVVNYMKGDLTVEEFIFWCKKVLEHNGYKVNKK